jgi:hypothetical protein
VTPYPKFGSKTTPWKKRCDEKYILSFLNAPLGGVVGPNVKI